MSEFRSVQAEFMRPGQIRAALSKRSVVYIPIGATEFHQEHLPIGLDALNAHGITSLLATRTGGIVLPPLFIGIGGGHKNYPWTIMMDDDKEIKAILLKTLSRLEILDVKLVVIFSGHFAPEQLAMIESIEADWSAQNKLLKVLALGINLNLDGAPSPDHAGLFETTVLSRFHPETIDISALPSIADFPSIDPDGDSYGLHRHNPDHVLWGIFGPDPRRYQPDEAEGLTLQLCEAIEARVSIAISGS